MNAHYLIINFYIDNMKQYFGNIRLKLTSTACF